MNRTEDTRLSRCRLQQAGNIICCSILILIVSGLVLFLCFLFVVCFGFDTCATPPDWQTAGLVEETWSAVLDHLVKMIMHDKYKVYADNDLGVGGLPSIILLCFSASSLLNSCDGVAKWPSCNKQFWHFGIFCIFI